MAEASLSMQPKGCNTKKRKSENGQMTKNKKAISHCSTSADINLIGSTDMDHMEVNQTVNQIYRKNYHLGGRKYVVFYGAGGIIEEIYIKEWDGEKVTMEGVKLNLSRFLMILHNVEIIDHTIDKILKGAQDQDTKIHIGASYYLSANSPYKTVAIRMWKKGASGDLFPTKLGISLTLNQWREFCKISNILYAERMEIFTFIPCIMEPGKKGHNKLKCIECADIDQAPMWEVDFDIPI